jgi:hypothetical protein
MDCPAKISIARIEKGENGDWLLFPGHSMTFCYLREKGDCPRCQELRKWGHSVFAQKTECPHFSSGNMSNVTTSK